MMQVKNKSNLNQGPLEQEAGVLLTQPALYRCPVIHVYINDSAAFSVLSRSSLPELSTGETDLKAVYPRCVYSKKIKADSSVPRFFDILHCV
jgi:hypothetical protein